MIRTLSIAAFWAAILKPFSAGRCGCEEETCAHVSHAYTGGDPFHGVGVLPVHRGYPHFFDQLEWLLQNLQLCRYDQLHQLAQQPAVQGGAAKHLHIRFWLHLYPAGCGPGLRSVRELEIPRAKPSPPDHLSTIHDRWHYYGLHDVRPVRIQPARSTTLSDGWEGREYSG